MSLFIMACSAPKRTGVHAAGMLYKTRQHDALFNEFFSEGAYCSHEAAIFSAQHGLIKLNQPISTYELCMTPEIAAAYVADPTQLDILRDLVDGHETVYVYGGEMYRTAILAMLNLIGFGYGSGTVVEVVGQNRGCGDHFSALQALFYGMSVDA